MQTPGPVAGDPAADIRRSARSLGLLLAALLGGWGLWRVWQGGAAWWPWLAAATAAAGAALWRPALLVPLTRGWLKLGDLLHGVVNPLVMLLLFVLVVTPTGLLMRLFGKDPLRLRLDRQAASYWIPRDDAQVRASSMKDQF